MFENIRLEISRIKDNKMRYALESKEIDFLTRL